MSKDRGDLATYIQDQIQDQIRQVETARGEYIATLNRMVESLSESLTLRIAVDSCTSELDTCRAKLLLSREWDGKNEAVRQMQQTLWLSQDTKWQSAHNKLEATKHAYWLVQDRLRIIEETIRFVRTDCNLLTAVLQAMGSVEKGEEND